MQVRSLIADKVEEVYNWIEEQIKENVPEDKRCQGCGKCCDFENFGHRLFITSPELLHFRIEVGKDNILPMEHGVCPYMQDGKCTVHENRFSGCRIFFCKAEDDFQSWLSEESIRRFKEICDKYGIPYQYKELSAALNFLAGIQK